ncbi:MAG: peptide chain release factor N(5)-glutamine methyltransferase [Candidatus Aminicenantes bacterium]|nr:peptide chain release factor N(5)-glutamine methyltransferase [Candidatus Aminicenantes bacterium]
MRYSELFHSSLSKFKDGSVEKKLEIEILIREAFKLSKTDYWIKKNDVITDEKALQKFSGWLGRLLKAEPLAYIIEKKESFSREFYVNKNVLIPRPETEILIEEAAALVKKMAAPVTVLDIGTGSGIIAVNLALETGARVAAVDSSKGALQVLKRNITRHHVEDKVFPVCADLFPPVGNPVIESGLFDVIVSNPPYVSPQEWENLPPGVKDYEPRQALIAGEGGTAVIERIAAGARDYLKPGGSLLLEIGCGQAVRVEEILRRAGFVDIEFIKDYSNILRIVRSKLK